jgi:hypothetical protein
MFASPNEYLSLVAGSARTGMSDALARKTAKTAETILHFTEHSPFPAGRRVIFGRFRPFWPIPFEQNLKQTPNLSTPGGKTRTPTLPGLRGRVICHALSLMSMTCD